MILTIPSYVKKVVFPLEIFPVVIVGAAFIIILITLGLSWLLLSLGIFVRNLGQAIAIIVQILLVVTPSFYSVEQLSRGLRFLVMINPLSSTIDGFRRILTWGQCPDWDTWGLATLISALAAILGFTWFSILGKLSQMSCDG